MYMMYVGKGRKRGRRKDFLYHYNKCYYFNMNRRNRKKHETRKGNKKMNHVEQYI